MKKRIITYSSIILIIAFFIVKYIEFLDVQFNVIYIENSLLYKNYNDLYTSQGGNPSYETFLKVMQKKDNRIYHLLKEGKLRLQKDDKENVTFIWFRTNEGETVRNSDLTFFKYLFFKKNIFINFNFKEYFDYKENIIYKPNENSFIATDPLNTNKIQLQYANKINCKPCKIFVEDYFAQHTYLLIQANNIKFINSTFSNYSKEIIYQTFKDMYKNNKDTFLINLCYYNIEDLECLD